eukprot:12741199-Ditylum_brightwellii.AAC.1
MVMPTEITDSKSNMCLGSHDTSNIDWLAQGDESEEEEKEKEADTLTKINQNDTGSRYAKTPPQKLVIHLFL